MAKEKNKPFDQLSDYEKFTAILDSMRMIINDALLDKLLFTVNNYIVSEREKTEAKVTSAEFRELKSFIKLYAESKNDDELRREMKLKMLASKIDQVYHATIKS